LLKKENKARNSRKCKLSDEICLWRFRDYWEI